MIREIHIRELVRFCLITGNLNPNLLGVGVTRDLNEAPNFTRRAKSDRTRTYNLTLPYLTLPGQRLTRSSVLTKVCKLNFNEEI